MDSDPYIGDIGIFAGNFAPQGWMFCEGQMLAVSQYPALFSIIGTTYGGDGRTTFQLPDMRGLSPLGGGQAAGLTPRALASQGGVATVPLPIPQYNPSHSHVVQFHSGVTGTLNSPNGNVIAPAMNGHPPFGPFPTGASVATLSPTALGPTGGGTAHNNMPPYVVLRFVIAFDGTYPTLS